MADFVKGDAEKTGEEISQAPQTMLNDDITKIKSTEVL